MSNERNPCWADAFHAIGIVVPPANDFPTVGDVNFTMGACSPSPGSGRMEKYPGEKNHCRSFELLCERTTCLALSVLTTGNASGPIVVKSPPSDSRKM